MRVQGLVKLLACCDCHRQSVLLWSERTSGVRGHRAGWVISAIEIQHDGSIAHRAGIEETSAGVGVSFCAGVTENDKQTLSGISPQGGELELLAVKGEHSRPR